MKNTILLLGLFALFGMLVFGCPQKAADKPSAGAISESDIAIDEPVAVEDINGADIAAPEQSSNATAISPPTMPPAQPPANNTSPPIPPPAVQPPATPPAQPSAYTIEADDFGFYPGDVIKARKGDNVKITFLVRTKDVYFGGTDIKSPFFNTGKIPPGGNGTVEFTASESFKIESFWPSSSVKKAELRVEVQ